MTLNKAKIPNPIRHNIILAPAETLCKEDYLFPAVFIVIYVRKIYKTK